jgi:hypothetical protein
LWASNQSWLLYDVTGTTTGFGNLSLNTIDWLDAIGGQAFSTLAPGAFSLSQSGNDIYLNYAVPEPSRAVLMLIGSAGLLLRRRRKM